MSYLLLRLFFRLAVDDMDQKDSLEIPINAEDAQVSRNNISQGGL